MKTESQDLQHQRDGETEARDMYSDNVPCWLEGIHVFRIPDHKLKDDWSGMHYTEILKDENEDIDDYIIDGFSGHLNEPEPACEDSEHDTCNWDATYEIEGGLKENPGVWGHGGGVKIFTHCTHCDCSRTRTVNTWDQNPCNGSQGHETISYGHRDE